jgi:hypothetical protein
MVIPEYDSDSITCFIRRVRIHLKNNNIISLKQPSRNAVKQFTHFAERKPSKL